MARKKHLFDWTGYFAKHLVSAMVEDAADTDVVLTFAPPRAVKAFSRSVKTEFTLVGKTVDSIALDYALGTLTVVVTVAYGVGANFDLTFNTVKKGDTIVQEITNNVA